MTERASSCQLLRKEKNYTFAMVSGKLPPRKIVPRPGSGFGLGLALELGLGVIFLGGNFPRIVCDLTLGFN